MINIFYLIILYLQLVIINIVKMSRKNRSLIKGFAVIIAGISILSYMGVLVIPGLSQYNYWILVIAFGLVLLVSK